MSTLEMIVAELKALPAPKLAEAAALIHSLRETDRTARWAALERSSSILSDAEGADLERVITEGCAKIDARDW